MSAGLEHMWEQVQRELSDALGETTYRVWLEPLRARELAHGRLLVETPPQACGWIRDRFGRLLQQTTSRVIGSETILELVPAGGDDDLYDRPRMAARPSPQPPLTRTTHPHRARPGHPLEPPSAAADPPLANPKLTFEQFVIGDCNRLAHAAALAVAEMPRRPITRSLSVDPPVSARPTS